MKNVLDITSMSHNRRKPFWLGMAAATLLGFYLLLALRYPLGPSLANPRASWATMVGPTGSNAIWHLALYLGLTLLYLTILCLLVPSQEENAAPTRAQSSLIFVTWLACSVVLMTAAPAGESHDIFDYTFRGRMIAEYQANPLVEVPREFDLSTPYTHYLAWRKHVDTYGPVWEASSAAVAVSVRQVTRWLGWWDKDYPVCPKSPESCRLLEVYITGYRLLAIILTGLSGWLVHSMVRHNHPALAPLGLAIWLLNPITLIATALGGHNDAVMLTLVLLCWWLLQRQHPFLALLALILATHVKLTALIWLPTCAVWILWHWGWGRGLKLGLASVISGLALSWLLYAPFGGWGSLPRMLQERAEFLANSLWSILKFLLINLWNWPTGSAQRLSTGLPSWSFVIGALLITLWMYNLRPKRWRSRPVTSEEANRILWRALLAVSLLYILVGSFWFQHWYVLWILAPAALLPDSRLTRWLLPWLAFGALFSNVAMDFLLNTTLKGSQSIIKHVLPVVMIWGPVTIAAIVIRSIPSRSTEKGSTTASRPIVQN